MTAENFCYWLKGYFEINDNQPRPAEFCDSLNSEQIKIIKQHLDYVFAPTITSGEISKDLKDALRYSSGGIVSGPYGSSVC